MAGRASGCHSGRLGSASAGAGTMSAPPTAAKLSMNHIWVCMGVGEPGSEGQLGTTWEPRVSGEGTSWTKVEKAIFSTCIYIYNIYIYSIFQECEFPICLSIGFDYDSSEIEVNKGRGAGHKGLI